MSAAKIDVIARLQHYEDAARSAGNQELAGVYKVSVLMIQRAMARAEAVETVRDRFAIAAMPEIYRACAREFREAHPEWREVIARNAYLMADAMMEARTK